MLLPLHFPEVSSDTCTLSRVGRNAAGVTCCPTATPVGQPDTHSSDSATSSALLSLTSKDCGSVAVELSVFFTVMSRGPSAALAGMFTGTVICVARDNGRPHGQLRRTG